MANIDQLDLTKQIPHAGEYGNKSTVTESITIAAATVADVLRIAKIPANSRLLDLDVVNTASTAATTMTFGFENADGSGAVPAHFTAAKAISTASRIRADAVNAPVLLGSQDGYITGTLAGANIATSTTITVTATFEYIGG